MSNAKSFEDTYLPDCLKDFHDQKDLFKAMHHAYRETFSKTREEGRHVLPGWADGQVYVIDFFLWFMAQHGYKLQRWKAGYHFRKPHETISQHRELVMTALAEIFTNRPTGDDGPTQKETHDATSEPSKPSISDVQRQVQPKKV